MSKTILRTGGVVTQGCIDSHLSTYGRQNVDIYISNFSIVMLLAFNMVKGDGKFVVFHSLGGT